MNDRPGDGIAGAAARPTDTSPIFDALVEDGVSSFGERTLFLRRRWKTYIDLLLPPGIATDDATRGRLLALANAEAFEDLQALLGRRGELAAALELELYRFERGCLAEQARQRALAEEDPA